MPEEIRPLQTQSFPKAAGAVRAPLIMEVVPQSGGCQIAWTRKPGIIDGFIILLGSDPGQLREEMKVREIGRPNASQKITLNHLLNGQIYFVAVVSFVGDRQSEIASMWKFVPNQSLLHRVSEKVSLSLLPRPVENQPVRTTPIQTTVLQQVPAVGQKNQPTRPATSEAEPTVPLASEPKPIPVSIPKPIVSLSLPPPSPPPPPRYGPEVAAICGGCRGEVVLKPERKLYVCRTCQTEYVQRVTDEKFIPVRLLTDGVCFCCDPRRPLVKNPADTKLLKCSKSGEFYTRKADQSGLVKISELEYGLCSCCIFRYPLVRDGNNIVCSNQPTRIYIRNSSGQWILKPPEPEQNTNVDIDEIDKALAEGSAVMLPGGVLSTNSPRRPRRRSRR